MKFLILIFLVFLPFLACSSTPAIEEPTVIEAPTQDAPLEEKRTVTETKPNYDQLGK